LKSLEDAFGPNSALVEELYEQYREDPASVPNHWKRYFDEVEKDDSSEELAEQAALTDNGDQETQSAETKDQPKKEAQSAEEEEAEEEEPEQLGLPLIGRVAAGEPILAQEHVESHCKIDPLMFKPAADFLLRVNGMSMKDIGIMDGDLLAVHRTQIAENGQVIVARVDDNVTVKRLEKAGRKVLLHAENEAFLPIEVDLENESFNIEGLAVGVIRNADWM
jgi:repressor LexA